MTWQLYYAPGSCALASHLALAHAKADYSAINVSFATGDQRKPEYLAINPKGRVPALVTERGILTETPAILLFIAQSYPAAGLAPLDDPFALAQLQAFNSYLCSTVHVAHAHRMRGHRWADDPSAIAEMRRKVPQTVGECFALIESELLTGPWVMGDRYSLCDLYLFTLAQWLEADGVPTHGLSRVVDHRRRMAALPIVQQVLAAEQQQA
jgi:glutathione S-transferase